jgi:NAD(P) transhydrogenase subunit beta
MKELGTADLFAHFCYLISISLFILGIKLLGKVKTARRANMLAAFAMLLAVIGQLVELGTIDYTYIIIGILIGSIVGTVIAVTAKMTAMPQLVAIFNGFGGGASALVGLSLFAGADKGVTLSQMIFEGDSGVATAVTLSLSVIIGAVTLTGSVMAYLKLSDRFGDKFGKPILLTGRHLINSLLVIGLIASTIAWVGYIADPSASILTALIVTGLSLLLGILLVIPIGGADMPVVISLLNSYSGLAASATGFALESNVLIVSGALVGASGIILTQIMCKAMNRSLANVILGGFGAVEETKGAESGYTNVKSADSEEAALDFSNAQTVIFVPGYGLAVSQGQGVLRELADLLKKRGVNVRYAIHPVAGRMPGHMNVLLAESNVPYDELYEMDAINKNFQQTDITLVVGANDVVNPSAKDDPRSPLYGMPVLNVEESRTTYVIKRSLSPGFAGVKNTLFEKDNCRMIYGDAKKVIEDLIKCVSET